MPDRPRVLLLLPPTTYRAEAFLEATERLNVAVTIGADAASWPNIRQRPDFVPLTVHDSAAAIRAVLSYASERPIHVVLGVDDGTAVLAAALAEALGLPHNPVEAVSAARNKYVMRQRLQAVGVPVPSFTMRSVDDDPIVMSEQMRYPCVLKPLILSASCGVIRANDPAEFIEAFRRIVALLGRLKMRTITLPYSDQQTTEPGRQILVEAFVPGVEVAVEALLTDGRLTILAVFDKPDPLEGPYFEETIYVTPSRLSQTVQSTIAETVDKAAAALGLREGPIHGELRINDGGVWVIEVAARSIGGRCSRTLQFAAGISLEEVILRHALRQPLPSLQRTGAAGVMMLPIPRAGMLQQVSGEEEARSVPGIEEVTVTAAIGQDLVPLPEGTRYLGFLVARGAAPDEVEDALREAHRKLRFVIGQVDRTKLPQVVRF